MRLFFILLIALFSSHSYSFSLDLETITDTLEQVSEELSENAKKEETREQEEEEKRKAKEKKLVFTKSGKIKFRAKHKNFKRHLLLIIPDCNSMTEQWVGDMKKANDILNNASNYDELVNENKRLTNVIANNEKINKVKIDAKLTVVELKENLKLNLTSDLAPSIN